MQIEVGTKCDGEATSQTECNIEECPGYHIFSFYIMIQISTLIRFQPVHLPLIHYKAHTTIPPTTLHFTGFVIAVAGFGRNCTDGSMLLREVCYHWLLEKVD